MRHNLVMVLFIVHVYVYTFILNNIEILLFFDASSTIVVRLVLNIKAMCHTGVLKCSKSINVLHLKLLH